MSRTNDTTAAKEEAKPAMVPKLRFPEFRETWETNGVFEIGKLFVVGGVLLYASLTTQISSPLFTKLTLFAFLASFYP